MFDVFQKGLIRGSERLPFDPSKKYAYVEHPKEGWRVYLRSCVFLHPAYKPFDKKNFLVVKDTSSNSWEPPKGQMEGKDLKDKSVLESLKDNAIRETKEESHISIKNLKHTGLIFQARESDYPSNTYFQYHIFQGFITQNQVQESLDTFEWIKEHPKGFARWSRDRQEKDDVAWFNKTTRLNPRWCPGIVKLYFKFFTK